MITPEKIEEWIKEAQERPASASMIIQHLANRLRYLAQRNEELHNENIALMSGERVEEYERRITHLEYQLDLLKRRLSGEIMLPHAAGDPTPQPANTSSILVYDHLGHILRIPVHLEEMESGIMLTQIQTDFASMREPPGMLALLSSEELLLVFNTGRVAAIPVEEISAYPASRLMTLDQAPIPDEPRGNERLACLVPIARLPLIDLMIQVSRKAYAKKIGSSMIESILANQYIGSGVNLPGDQTFNVILCGNADQLILVSRMGYLLRIQAQQISHSIEGAMRLGKSDHLVSGFLIHPQQSVLIATNAGKLIHRTEDSFEVSTVANTRGSPVVSSSRRDQGVRVVGAAAVSEDDWFSALHMDGKITLHSMTDLFASGTIPVENELLAFTRLPIPRTEEKSTGEG
jgi:DNA gyrase/topoisomerase IV subunit A